MDGARIASQSPAVIGLLRGGLGFHGVIVTDSMEAAASLATGSIEQVSERAVEAGADLLLRPAAAPTRRRSGTSSRVARNSPALRARVREAAARVLALEPTRPARPADRRSRRRPAILHGHVTRTPNIGVTCNVEVVRYGLWTEPAAMVPFTYVTAIARAGARPLLLAPTPPTSTTPPSCSASSTGS